MLAAGLSFTSLLGSIFNTLVQLSTTRQNSGIITPLSPARISSFKPFTRFASTAYCYPNTTIDWSCGADCAANPDFIPIASGGDGGFVQFWYVGFSPSQETVIVAHQGTDTSKMAAIATDADLLLKPLDATLFPDVSPLIEVHKGFAHEQAKTAMAILSAVQTAINTHGATQVTIVGHSLGAAIALLDAVYLPLHISGVSFKMIGYGMPRVGNQAFADYIDTHLHATHINNREDFVPIIPGELMAYRHPSGEVHIIGNNQWVSCPGQDNPSKNCSAGDVPDIFNGEESHHGGPYDGVTMAIGC